MLLVSCLVGSFTSNYRLLHRMCCLIPNVVSGEGIVVWKWFLLQLKRPGSMIVISLCYSLILTEEAYDSVPIGLHCDRCYRNLVFLQFCCLLFAHFTRAWELLYVLAMKFLILRSFRCFFLMTGIISVLMIRLVYHFGIIIDQFGWRSYIQVSSVAFQCIRVYVSRWCCSICFVTWGFWSCCILFCCSGKGMGFDSELSQIQRYGNRDWDGFCCVIATHYWGWYYWYSLELSKSWKYIIKDRELQVEVPILAASQGSWDV